MVGHTGGRADVGQRRAAHPGRLQAGSQRAIHVQRRVVADVQGVGRRGPGALAGSGKNCSRRLGQAEVPRAERGVDSGAERGEGGVDPRLNLGQSFPVGDGGGALSL